jgi:nucleoside-diphosphate-sugar epimerase
VNENPLLEDLEHVLARTEEVWEELRAARIFITGGSGFFGCWLLETFGYANEVLNLGAHAVVLTRDAEAFRRKAPHLTNYRGIELLEGDLATCTFPAASFSHVIHAAIDYRSPLELFDSILDGTRKTLDFARASGARRYLLASSGAVYGRQPPDLTHVDESFPGAPDSTDLRSAYGEAKRASEFLCSAFYREYGIETTIARGFAFVGPYLPLRSGSAIGNFIADALGGGPIKISGDGTPQRSYLYGADLAIWLWKILCHGVSARAYNVGSEAAVSILDAAKIVVDEIDPAAKVEVAQTPVAGRPAERYVPSVKRARSELGLESWIDFKEAIRRTARWHKQRK